MINDIMQRVQALFKSERALLVLRIDMIRDSLSNNTIWTVALFYWLLFF